MFDHLRFEEPLDRIVHERHAFAAEQGILNDVLVDHAVNERVLAHSDKEVAVPEPTYAFVHVGHRAQADFGIERIHKPGNKL